MRESRNRRIPQAEAANDDIEWGLGGKGFDGSRQSQVGEMEGVQLPSRRAPTYFIWVSIYWSGHLHGNKYQLEDSPKERGTF